MCKPYIRSSIKVIIRTEKDFGIEIKDNDMTIFDLGVEIKTDNMSIFDFNDIDFSDFTFNTLDTPLITPFNRKVRKYQTLQIVIRNDKANQGFGVFQIVKRYRVMNYVK